MYLGTFDARAVEVLMLLRERAAEYGMIDVEAKALVDLCHPLAWASSNRALEIVDEALRLSEAQRDPVMRAHTRAGCMMRRIWTRGWSGDDAAECARALDEIRHRGEPHDIASRTLDCNFVDFFSSHYRKAADDAVASLAILAQGHHGSMYLSYAQSLKEFSVSWSLTFLGEWGAAFREMDSGISLAEKNGDAYRGQTLLMSRAWALVCAMDFAGARAITESLLPALQQRPPWRRFCLTIAGAAAVGLGDYERAADRLSAAGQEMDRHGTLGDWYWRLVQGWALTTSGSHWAICRGRTKVPRRSLRARPRLRNAPGRHSRGTRTPGCTPLERHTGRQRRVENAIAALEGFEAPVAAWQVHATAADVARARGDSTAASRHRSTSRSIIDALADSFGADNRAQRQTFLDSPAVARVFDGSTDE
jgi:hypothetical protein